MNTQQLSEAIRQRAQALGFYSCGFAEAGFLEQEARYLEQWLRAEMHGTMAWMEGHFDKRTDPRLLVPGARSVISLLYNYMPPPEVQQPETAPRISTYAWGPDYHTVLKEKLYELLHYIGECTGAEPAARVFTDSAPVMDKVWAARAGLGWIGKHTNLIVPQAGSWFFIGEIILDVELDYSTPIRDFCGTCTRCIDACPTGALRPWEIDARKCISYLTIELREAMPEAFRGETAGWAYGCDICQEVCPWNSFAVPDSSGAFLPLDHIYLPRAGWEALEPAAWKQIIRRSAMSRIKWDKWLDNLKASEAAAENL